MQILSKWYQNGVEGIKVLDDNFCRTVISPDLKLTLYDDTKFSICQILYSYNILHPVSSYYFLIYNFNFHITNFPFLSSNIPSSPAYGVFISQLIRYTRACSSYECFILRARRLSSKLLKQGYLVETLEIVIQEILWSIRGILLSNME